MPLQEFMDAETRFSVLKRSHPEAAKELAKFAQETVDKRFRYYEQLASLSYEKE
jgi:pyruvate-ferredoxin/flavodoxin oxidoreductase